MGHRRLFWHSAAVLTITGLLPVAAAAQSVQITGASATSDATIYSESDNANGGGNDLSVGQNGQGNERRALIRFDVAGEVPAGATITAVTLSLEVTGLPGTNPPTDPIDIAIHRLTSSWTTTTTAPSPPEGQGTSPQSGDVTWTYRSYDTSSWSTSGGDFAGTASDTSPSPFATGAITFTGATMVSDVQNWLDNPAQNHGWIVRTPVLANRAARVFGSSENTDNEPVLAISYDPPPEPTGACCAADGGCGVILDADSGSCDGVYQGEGTECVPNPCPAPEGACCLPVASATCEQQAQSVCEEAGGTYGGDLVGCEAVSCPVVLEPFVDPLPIPKTATPKEGAAGGAASYRIKMVQLRRRLHRDLPRTTVWGFDDGTGGSFPGPTIEARTDEPVSVAWVNNLREGGELRTEHYLSVDQCPHGADDNVPRTVVHLHGGHVAARYDGYPEDAYPPGEEETYEYPNWQHASTLWYHDHAVGITRLNVYMGLAGLYVIRDDEEESLDLPSGEYDVPLVIMDRSFNPDGSLSYPELWQGMFTGESILVNGKVWPHYEVDRGKYRFRILNASGTRTYDLSLSDGRSMALIGTDGGILPAPEVLSSIVVAPGERIEVIIDFEVYEPGTEIILENSAPANYPNGTDGVVPNVMKFVVGENDGDQRTLRVNLRDLPRVPKDDQIAAERDFVLASQPDPCTGGNAWQINGLGWNDITEKPQLGTTEIWRFINDSGMMHPMHMHLVFFQVMDRQQFVMVDGEPVAVGDPIEPAPNEQGWHDTIQVMPGEMVRVIAHFTDFTGLFPYHCHILEHEDHDMMRQFEAVTVCGDGARGLPEEECDDGQETETCDTDCTFAECGDGTVNNRAGEECDDGNTEDGDGCSAACEDQEIEKDPDDGGCFCNAGSPSAGPFFLALLALLPLVRRRRRSV